MRFLEIVGRAKQHLRDHGRVSFRALRREFALDDDALEDLAEELVAVQGVARRDASGLVWRDPVPAGGPTGADSAAAELPTAPRAERRQLTVLFCDLVDSTRLAGSMDPEDWREIVRRYQGTAVQTLDRLGGTVAQYLGDGVLVYFGHPHAHEDDAERAVRAGLQLLEAVRGLDSKPLADRGERLQIRIGIHTGPVVVGEMGSGERRETLALGDTTNIAARIQARAEPGHLLLSESTLRLTPGVFRTRDVGWQSLRGVEQPVHVYQALSVSGVRSRLDVAAAGGLTPLVGRERELGLLCEQWDAACRGRGQTILLGGEAGIGKSRLVHALREHLMGQAHSWLECRASPHTQDSPLYPVLELVRSGLGLAPDDSPEARLAKLETGLESAGLDPGPRIPLLAELLDIPTDERYASPNLSPESRRERTLETLADWLVGLGRLQPAVLLVEDLHWLDPSSVDLVGRILDRLAMEPVLLLLTHRLEFEPPWTGRGGVTPLRLARLPERQRERLVRAVLGERALANDLVEKLAARSDGVPLYAEELTRGALEAALHAPSRGPSAPAFAVPETLQDSLMGRLDALGEAKEVAQLASVVGREFEFDLVRRVAEMPEDALSAALQRAVDDELLYRRGSPPESVYLFKHALVRDAAYQSLLKRDRRSTHLRVARALEERPAEAPVELLAHHYSEAGHVDRALPLLRRAGEEAAARSANAEAIRHFERALGLVADLDDPAERKRQELALQVGIGAPSQLVRGYRTPETERAYTRALELCRDLGDTPYLPEALWGLYSFYLVGSDLDVAIELGQRLLDVAARERDRSLEMLGHLALGVPHFFGGEIDTALGHLDQSVELSDGRHDARAAQRYGQDPAIMARSFLAFSLWFTGRPDAALAKTARNLQAARELGHPFSLALAHAYAALLHTMMRRSDRALECSEAVVAISEEQAFPLWRGFGVVTRARARVELGGDASSVDEIQAGLSDVAATGTTAGGPLIVALLAEAQRAAGRTNDALGSLQLAAGLAETTGCRYWDAEVCRLRGDLLETSGSPASEVSALYEDALARAERQGARALALRAAVSRARVSTSPDEDERARSRLAELYSRFGAREETPDLADARRVLAQTAR